MIMGAMCFASLSMVCMLQAILHSKNLPTLVMLTTIAFFASDFLSLLFGYASWSRTELSRVALLLLACVGILMAKSRLTKPSLLSSIPAMMFAGIARALNSAALQHNLRGVPSPTVQRFYLLGAGYIIGGIWLLLWSDRDLAMAEIDCVPLIALAINTTATTTALLTGTSMIFPMGEGQPVDEFKTRETIPCETKDATTLLALVGLTGCYSALSARRSYINWVQYCCFALALLCIGCKSALGRWHDSAPNSRGGLITYELLEDQSLPIETDNENHSTLNDTTVSPWALVSRRDRKSDVPRICQIIAVLTLCISAVAPNYFTPDFQKMASLDRELKPEVAMEVVISMYKEPVGDVWSFIAGLKSAPETSKASVLIYTKDEDADIKNLKMRTGADEVVKLANIGREGETHLHHINKRWDSLARHTMFLQADVKFDREFYSRLGNYFDADRTGFLNLGRADVCDCDTCGDRHFWSDKKGLFPQYHNKIYNSSDCNNVVINYKGSFMVSAARVRGISKTIYNELWQAFTDQNSWAHQPEFLQGKSDSMNAPYFGYTMERMWSLLFQCSDMNVAWKCPSYMSGWRIGGEIADCQCFDNDAPR
ncbi:hypothetical protein HBI56_199100 [Parastagonospora nodorum]|uniref:Glycosyltransferase 2-like domain-containing protein n=2 Tax=Phaeosphaeria nodorum (strain SN15 / ATCC MYA-4574 / FGSC 10173) TaxID=321614 RepID=A0A7U2I6J0_PHANO|nr:hypothetical protein HBH56_204090 [Parastagonospora nodorum]QRD01702.1 hypothetical protein JI435_145540 [Parastagonospora nodorum SN15]KAH3924009.1 hypothetical protein HBH54_202970 [Parastagonospora nodorum]KAH3941504.1 hypothetical protein HBH53_201360 [Parastagonospora nodorum]KAH3964043.1 hypothetical protein HBH52_214460 [Parastagonospora nodorum]